MLGTLKRSFWTRWNAGHRFSAMARLIFTVCWLPLYGVEVLTRSDLGTLARLVSPVLWVTVQLLITSALMVLLFKFFVTASGSRRDATPTNDGRTGDGLH